MPNKSYLKGYRLERRIIKSLESLGYICMRAGKSKFPDGFAARREKTYLPPKFWFESKYNKYLSRKEKEEAQKIKEITGLPFIVFYNKKGKILHYEI